MRTYVWYNLNERSGYAHKYILFSAIVGQERMRRALIFECNQSPHRWGPSSGEKRGDRQNPRPARALAALLPEVQVVGGLPIWL